MKKQILIIILSMVIGMVFFSTANAGTFHWVGGSSANWSDPDNWLENGVPTSNIPGPSDDVIFDSNAANNCIINQDINIHSLYISAEYLLEVIIPVDINVYISGNLTIEDNLFLSVWNNSGNIIFNGTGNQIISIETHSDWPFYNFTIDKPSGIVILDSDITISNEFNLISGSLDCNGFLGPCPPPCTPPQTGGIYHIGNNFAF